MDMGERKPACGPFLRLLVRENPSPQLFLTKTGEKKRVFPQPIIV
jgi:hypothetical protein